MMENVGNKLREAVIGKYCIVRGKAFGVFAGTVEELDGSCALMKDARRLWYWSGAASLSQLALEGVKNPSGCKFTVTVDSVLLLDVIEVIPATEEARRIIGEVPVWRR